MIVQPRIVRDGSSVTYDFRLTDLAPDDVTSITIPEPHISDKKITGRQDYVKEIKSYMETIRENIINKYDNIRFVLFPGDIFNKGFNNLDEYFYWIDWFSDVKSTLAERGGAIFSAVGNHELTFSDKNPFWRLVSDDSYRTSARFPGYDTTPKGFKDIINVVDKLTVVTKGGVVNYYFGHYGKYSEIIELRENDKKEEDPLAKQTNVLISHYSIISSVIARNLKERFNRDPLYNVIPHERIESMTGLFNFNYVFNGHMHKAYSVFTLSDDDDNSKTNLIYLGSLGRTNKQEVDNNDLVRTLPVVCATSYTAIPLKLNRIEETLNEDHYAEVEEKKDLKLMYTSYCSSLIDTEDPIKSLESAIDKIDLKRLLNDAVNGDRFYFYNEMLEKVNRGVDI